MPIFDIKKDRNPRLTGSVAAQFKNLDMRQPNGWPLYPRLVLYFLVGLTVVALCWFLFLGGVKDALNASITQEDVLKGTYKDKLIQAVNLDVLREQHKQVQQYVLQLEKQLPSKAEMDALLSDINQAGLGRSLQFELFKPGSVVVKEYYAELPIQVKVSGNYHDIGAFAADVASLSRIVTLNNISVVPSKSGNLDMTTTAKTFRYLDPEEISSNKKDAQSKKKDVKSKGKKS